MCLGRTVSTDGNLNTPDRYVEGKFKTVLDRLIKAS